MAVANRRSAALLATILVVMLSLSACSWFRGWFGDDELEPVPVAVLDVQAGQCFQGLNADEDEIRAELSTLPSVPCTEPHRLESYALVEYQAPEGVAGDLFPGTNLLRQFAEGRCAEEFATYVGISYQDSELFYTWLLPSARGWEQNQDRRVLCFVVTNGEELTATVKDTRQ